MSNVTRTAWNAVTTPQDAELMAAAIGLEAATGKAISLLSFDTLKNSHQGSDIGHAQKLAAFSTDPDFHTYLIATDKRAGVRKDLSKNQNLNEDAIIALAQVADQPKISPKLRSELRSNLSRQVRTPELVSRLLRHSPGIFTTNNLSVSATAAPMLEVLTKADITVNASDVDKDLVLKMADLLTTDEQGRTFIEWVAQARTPTITRLATISALRTRKSRDIVDFTIQKATQARNTDLINAALTYMEESESLWIPTDTLIAAFGEKYVHDNTTLILRSCARERVDAALARMLIKHQQNMRRLPFYDFEGQLDPQAVNEFIQHAAEIESIDREGAKDRWRRTDASPLSVAVIRHGTSEQKTQLLNNLLQSLGPENTALLFYSLITHEEEQIKELVELHSNDLDPLFPAVLISNEMRTTSRMYRTRQTLQQAPASLAAALQWLLHGEYSPQQRTLGPTAERVYKAVRRMPELVAGTSAQLEQRIQQECAKALGEETSDNFQGRMLAAIWLTGRRHGHIENKDETTHQIAESMPRTFLTHAGESDLRKWGNLALELTDVEVISNRIENIERKASAEDQNLEQALVELVPDIHKLTYQAQDTARQVAARMLLRSASSSSEVVAGLHLLECWQGSVPEFVQATCEAVR